MFDRDRDGEISTEELGKVSQDQDDCLQSTTEKSDQIDLAVFVCVYSSPRSSRDQINDKTLLANI